jgi:hypothetical protein
VLLGLLLVGCGSNAVGQSQTSSSPSSVSSPAASPSANATPPKATPSPALATLYAVLEAPRLNAQNTTVAIAGLNGIAHAKTHFTPRSTPYAPDVAVILSPEAHVAAGVVYFIDGRGVVRTLDRSGHVRQVAAFPLTQKQQEISFAVSPDGKQLVAAILTLPAVGNLIPGTGWHELVGPWKLAVARAVVGGATVTLHSWQASGPPSQPNGFANIVMAGWDLQGPVAVVGSAFSTQNGQFDRQLFFSGDFAHLDVATGLPGSGYGCQGDFQPWSVALDGTTVCAASRSAQSGLTAAVSVQTPGQAVWEPVLPDKPPFAFPGSFALSANGGRLAMDGAVVGRSASTVLLNSYFKPEGWFDAGTMIGVQMNRADPNRSDGMAYLRLSNPTHPVLLGFAGEFVGTIN